MKSYLAIATSLFFISCATPSLPSFFSDSDSNSTVDYSTPNPEVPENEHIAVCGQIDNVHQTYPTLKDLKADGAKFLSYGPCED